MITSMSKYFMRRSFEKTRYRFMTAPQPHFRGVFGIYLHVPFCYTFCSFCPFYKERYTEEGKQQYLNALLKEIETTDMEGTARWVYFGGGTPNTLSLDELESILGILRSKVQINSVGIELLPATLTEEYLHGLRHIGFTKVSLGVESFSEIVTTKTGRTVAAQEQVDTLINFAHSLGLWVNVDMMTGLPDQDRTTFSNDIQTAADIRPDQVTIYPFMVIRGVKAVPSIPSNKQFQLIEEGDVELREVGYDRKGVWTFALGDDVYDSSRDELIEDYAGFGPAAFSTYRTWKVVNPELERYINNSRNGERMAYVAHKSATSEDWRNFARMVYDLRCHLLQDVPPYINLFVRLLKATGYCRERSLTRKGILFAHAITKTVVESLPFPIQNPDCVVE
jgi:coproporphyrinogen III oxidase-like Fe-S oxidoreductase